MTGSRIRDTMDMVEEALLHWSGKESRWERKNITDRNILDLRNQQHKLQFINSFTK